MVMISTKTNNYDLSATLRPVSMVTDIGSRPSADRFCKIHSVKCA